MSTRSYYRVRRSAASHDQQGVALLIALVMLVIIGVSSVSIMRGALNSDLIANNTRTQTLAMQAAQIALRYCEDDLLKNVRLLPMLPLAPANQWETFGNWSDLDKVSELPSRYMESAASTFVPSTLPQCMIQQVMVGAKKACQITARGFSPDYSADDDGNTESGSVVWLQSTIAVRTCD